MAAAFRVLGGVLLVFLVLPLLGLVLRAVGPEFFEGLRNPAVSAAIRLSLLTTACTVVIVVLFGTPLAWIIARSQRSGMRWVETLVQLPVVVPPAVAGVAMLLVFGRRGLLGDALAQVGIELPFTTAAVVMAEVFVSAPFFLQAAIAAFRRVDERLLQVAETLGATPSRIFFRVALPLSLSGIISGAAMSWARALGEFGATLMFAGNMQGRTQTLPLAIYAVLETDLEAAQSLAVLMVVIAFGLLVLLRLAPFTRPVVPGVAVRR